MPAENQDRYTPSHPLTGDVAQACGEAAELVARYGDTATREQSAALIRAELSRIEAGAATAVVVGEKKRGKSSLINALLGRRDLLPVDVDVATSVHLTVGYAETPSVQVHLAGQDDPLPIETSEIARYAALDPATQVPYREDVQHVSVLLPAPLLAGGLILVDTPGVGGLVAGHAQVTLATLERADALLFVVNGEHELTASELAFLVQATTRIETVLFVLTQTDKYGNWDQVLQRNKDLIKQHAPRYRDAPWFPVSSRAKFDADEAAVAGHNDVASRRYSRSGFAALAAVLESRISRHSEELRLTNALHVAGTLLEPAVAAHERALRSLEQDPALAGEVKRRELQLSGLRQDDSSWRKILGERIKELEGALQLGFRRSVNDVRAAVEEKINTSGPDGVAEVEADLTAGVRGVWMQLENATQNGLTRIAAELANEFDLAGVDTLAAELKLPDRIHQLPAIVSQRHDGKGFLAVMERVTPAYGAGTLVFTVLTLATGGLALPAIAGLGVVAGIAGRRKHREELSRMRADATRHLNRVVGELLTEVPPTIHDALAQAQRRFSEGLAARLAQQSALLEAELADYQHNLRVEKAELEGRRAEVTAILDRLTAMARRIAELQRRLRP